MQVSYCYVGEYTSAHILVAGGQWVVLWGSKLGENNPSTLNHYDIGGTGVVQYLQYPQQTLIIIGIIWV